MKRIGVPAVIVLLLLVLSGCATTAAGSNARSGLDSIDGRVGTLRLLSVALGSPSERGSVHVAGGNAALLLTIANDGKDDDVLTGVSADGADKVVVRDSDGPAKRLEVAVPSGGVVVLRE